jgi:hypothetical protein
MLQYNLLTHRALKNLTTIYKVEEFWKCLDVG